MRPSALTLLIAMLATGADAQEIGRFPAFARPVAHATAPACDELPCDVPRAGYPHTRPPRPEPCQCAECCRKRIVVVRKGPGGGEDESGPVNEDQPVAPGAFIAPPAGGRVYGTSRGRELRGLRIKFPELSIGLPTIELPCIRHYREDSFMQTRSGVAPYMSLPTQPGVATVAAPGGGADESGRVRDKPSKDEDEAGKVDEPQKPSVECLQQDAARCEARLEQLRQYEQRIQAQLQEMRLLLERLHRQPPHSPPVPPTCPPCANSPPSHPDTQRADARPSAGEIQRISYGESPRPAYFVVPSDIRRLPPTTGQ